MDVSFREILEAVRGRAAGPEGDCPVRGVSTDTRTAGKDEVFFALAGDRFDGHDFLKEAVERGACALVVSEPKKLTAELKRSVRAILVEDTLTAYGDLARWYRQKFKIPVVAITGSSGKTTVKELTAHVLAQRFNVLKNRGTENNLVGVPRTILQLDAGHEVLVLELGTNLPGEIERLGSIAAPQIGVITQIGASHLEGLGSVEGVRAEKLSLIKQVDRGGVIVLNGHDPALAEIPGGMHRVLRVGLKEGCDLQAEQAWCHEKGSTFRVDRGLYEPRGGEKALLETPLIGRHNVQNALLAAAVGAALGVEFDLIAKALATFKPVPGRLSPRPIDGIHFLDDSYNSNPASLQAALETLKECKTQERKIVVVGDMLELGDRSEELHRQAGGSIARMLFDEVIAAGPQCRHLVDEALKSGFDPGRIRHAKDAVEAGKLLKGLAHAGDMVLVKGSRGTRMERVFEPFAAPAPAAAPTAAP